MKGIESNKILSKLLIVHSLSVDPWKLCVGVKYYIVHMYSMPYYTYGGTANFFFRAYSTYIYISKEQRCNEDLRGVGNFKIELVIRYLWRFF